ncbi:hypothetical protein [Mycobacterium sp. shizuoka-1]|uniref:hypothetical protein n=1 Tax=Mycobacterium sp. shizuoka-1 TaxID=2039281 RepID=UPI0011574C77|nr:hypothetical protein [Mycobacterium sp. shizuoka-1]
MFTIAVPTQIGIDVVIANYEIGRLHYFALPAENGFITTLKYRSIAPQPRRERFLAAQSS